MPGRSEEMKELVRKIGDNPHLVDELMASPTPESKKKKLKDAGVLDASEPAFKRQELTEQIEQLLLAAAQKEGAQVGSPERLVEWVGAIAAAAAGAMAA